MAKKRQRSRGTGTLFKRYGRGLWIASWYDHTGKRRERSTRTTDKAAAERILNKLITDVALRREGVIDAMVDRYAEAGRRQISEHLGDYKRALMDKGNTEKHAAMSAQRVQSILDATKAVYLSDVKADAVQHYLAERRAAGMSASSSNHYLTAIKGFLRWLVKERRASTNPLSHLSRLNARTDRRRIRRPLTSYELRRLLTTTHEGPTRYGLTGPVRSWAYRLAAETGFRRNELRSLTRSSFDLSEPTVMVEASYSKRRRNDVLPLRSDTAAELREFLADRPPDACVFNLPDRTADMLRLDLIDAGIEYEDDGGRVVDFHSLRHAFITGLAAAGVHPKQAQELARHSTISLTMDHYTHMSRGQLATAVESLPDLSRPERRRQRATGTYDSKAASIRQEGYQPKPQQFERETMQFSATRCEITGAPDETARSHKPLASATDSDLVRQDASGNDNAPGGTRTPDRRIRNPMLYPAELRAHALENTRPLYPIPASWQGPPRHKAPLDG